MKIAMISANADAVKRVYPSSLLSRIKEHGELAEGVVGRSSLEQYKRWLSNCGALFSTWGMEAFTEEEIRKYFPKLKYVFYAAGSVQHFAAPFLNCGVRVFSAWQANAVPVAEYTFAQIILANKGFFQSVYLTKTKRQEAQRIAASHAGNYDTTVGIVGAGAIGSMVCEKLRELHCRVVCYDPFMSGEKASRLCVEQVSIEELFEQSDVISNHLANKDELEGFYNYPLFKRMKPFATFINTGRGRQVVDADLDRALKEEPGRAAVLDVTYPEPLPKDALLIKNEQVFLTPHIAGSMGSEVVRMAEYMLADFGRVLNGSSPLYEVSLSMLKTMA